MFDQPRANRCAESEFFADGAASRPIACRTPWRAASSMRTNTRHRARSAPIWWPRFPFTVTLDVLERGHERYEIYCAPCHGRTGEGNGIVVQRGFPAPPSYHIDRLREAPDGHFLDVMTRGYGVMYSRPRASRPRIAGRSSPISAPCNSAGTPRCRMSRTPNVPNSNRRQ